MSRLVEELKAEHAHIRHVLAQVMDGTVTASGRFEMFLAAKAFLLRHLEKENQELYPVLRYAGQIDPEAQPTIETFEKEMVGISSQVMWFFAKYLNLETVHAGIKADKQYAGELVRSLETLTAILKRRLDLEELSLYSIYDCIVGDSARMAVEVQVSDADGARKVYIPIKKFA